MKKSRSVKSIILASGQALTTLVSILIAAVLARWFSKAEYGTYRQTLLVFQMAAPFLVLGLDRALYYFIPQGKRDSRSLLLENLALLLLGGAAFSLFLFFGGNEFFAERFNNPQLATTLLLFAPYLLLMISIRSLESCLIAVDRPEWVAIYNPISRLVVFLSVIGAAYFNTHVDSAILGLVVSSMVTSMAGVALMLRHTEGSNRPTLQGMKSQLGYSIPLGIASIMGTFAITLDKVIVSLLSSTDQFSVYVNGAMQLPLVSVITSSVASILLVDFTKLYAENRPQEMVALIHRAMSKTALILLPAMFYLLCVAPEFMVFLYGSDYAESAVPFRIYLLVLPLRTFVYGSIFMATQNNHLVLIQALLLLLSNAACSWLAVMWLGPNGAAWATVVTTYMVVLPFVAVFYPRILNVRIFAIFPLRRLVSISLASLAGAMFALSAKWFFANTSETLILTISGLGFTAITLAIFHYLRFLDIRELLARLKS